MVYFWKISRDKKKLIIPKCCIFEVFFLIYIDPEVNYLKKLDHLEKIALFYDTFVIDLWGVMHDGIKLYPNATKAVANLISMKKKSCFFQMHLDQV